MKSLSAIIYVDAAVRSIAAPVQLPLEAWRTAPVTRLPTGALISYVKQKPDTCGKRPSIPGIFETPFSSIVFSSAPFTCKVVTTLPNGSTASTCPREMGYGDNWKAAMEKVKNTYVDPPIERQFDDQQKEIVQ